MGFWSNWRPRRRWDSLPMQQPRFPRGEAGGERASHDDRQRSVDQRYDDERASSPWREDEMDSLSGGRRVFRPSGDTGAGFHDRPGAEREEVETNEHQRPSLLQFCLPIFGFTAALPCHSKDPQPEREVLREQILMAFDRFEIEASEAGYPGEDIKEARYALAIFFDAAIQNSEWTEKNLWRSGSLNHGGVPDPAAGEHFFERLERLREDQAEIKKVYLACLALGFLGKYATMEPVKRGKEITGLRRALVQDIRGPRRSRPQCLFPEAYLPSEPLEDPVPPPPRWWFATSLAVVVVCIVLYLFLFWEAGLLARKAAKAVTTMTESRLESTPVDELTAHMGELQ